MMIFVRASMDRTLRENSIQCREAHSSRRLRYHSDLSGAILLTGVSIRPARNGRGLYAARRFRPNETILKIAGRVFDWRVLLQRGGKFLANCIRFGPETYLDPADGPA